jgi:glycosyltransferase involved in cell wall biosynthesis
MHRPITFEVRIPTYERPLLLRRAINSLQKQTYESWKAIIFDDSTSFDSQAVVRTIADDRICYVRNHERLGAAGNIDQCFSPVSGLGGDYACLLEDDNFWLPDFLSLIRDHVGNERWVLLLANQRIYEEGVGLRPAAETTRRGWFAANVVDPLYLRAMLFFMEGVSNGGLVWCLERGGDLRVGPSVRATGLQEACRSLLVSTPFLFIDEAQAVWTLAPKARTARASETNREIGRGMQSIRDFVLSLDGRASVRIAISVAERLGLLSRLVEALAYSSRPHLAAGLLRGRARIAARAFAKGVAIRLFEPDPCASFIGSLAENGLVADSAIARN